MADRSSFWAQMKKGIVVFVVCALAAGVLWWWRHRGDTGATPPVPQDAGSNIDIASRPVAPVAQASLSVMVKDARGPLAKARVRIAPADGDVMVLETGTDGVATIKLAPGTFAVSASAVDHLPAAVAKLELTSGEIRKLPLVLEAGGRTLSGTVTDVSGGPIAGTRIDAAKLGGFARPEDAVATTLTGADGKYSLTVAEGQLMVAAHNADYAPQARSVEVGPTGATADFALVPGGVIEGVVLDDRSKQPVSGAMVIARRDNAGRLFSEGGARLATSTADGRFRITGLRPGAYELSARVDQRRTRAPTQVGLGVAESITDVTLLIGRSAVVRGTVVDGDGKPVPGAAVNTLGYRDDEVKADAKGAFVFEGLAPGGHMLVASADGFLAAAPTGIELADKDLDNVVLRVTKAGKLIGHVEPRQAGCEVSGEPDFGSAMGPAMMMMVTPATTGADGNFELGPLAPGQVELTARCTSGDQGTLKTTATASDAVVAVSAGASIAGKVLDGDGKPIAGTTVMASGGGDSVKTTIVNGMVTSGVQGITNTAGAYVLTGLQPGKYRMSALEHGRPMRTRGAQPVVTLAAAEKKTGVDLAVDRANGVIKGIVTGPDGKPLADAWVSVTQDLDSLLGQTIGKPHDGPPPDGPGETKMIRVESSDDGGEGGGIADYPPALTNAKGEFEIRGLPHLTFDVVAEAQAGKLRGRADNVSPDATLAIKALGVTSLSGTVRGPNGPAGLFTIELDGPTKTQRSFTDGTFTLGRVDPGNYTVRVHSSDGNGEAKVTVQPNTPATVDIMLVANAIVIGRLVDASGKPVPDVPVVVIPDHGDGKMMVSLDGPPPTSGADGRFRIEHKAGKSIVLVMMQRPPVFRPVVLEEGKTVDVGDLQITPPRK